MDLASFRKLWLLVLLGGFSSLIGWVITTFTKNHVPAWHITTALASIFLGIALLGIESAPERVDVPFVAMISRAGWEAIATLAAVLLIVVVIMTPFVVVMHLVTNSPQSAKSLIPLVFCLLGVVSGCGISWLARATLESWLEVFSIVGTAVTIVSAMGFAIAEML